MSLQLPADSLYKIIEYLAGDKSSLRSCLLVDRFCCKVAVRFLWRKVWDAEFNLSEGYQAHVPLSILSTLNACFSNESKNLLHEYGILFQHPLQNHHCLITFRLSKLFPFIKLNWLFGRYCITSRSILK